MSVVGIILAALVAAQLFVSQSIRLVTQSAWLDECLTHLVVNDASFIHGLSAIRAGVENTPPAFYLVVWPLARLAGGMSPVELRFLNALFIVLACVGTYATCRLFMDRARSAVGAFAIAIHPAVIVQTFQVRFYAFWLAGAAWLVYATILNRLHPGRRGLLWVRCGLAAIVTAAHWFGIIGVGLMVCGDVLASRRRARIDAMVPLVVAIGTLLACYPLLAAQRDGLTVVTWMEPLTLGEAGLQARAIYGVAPLALILAFAVWRFAARVPFDGDRIAWHALVPAFTLLLFPVALLVFSMTFQPVLRAKYMIPAVIPIGLLAALSCLAASDRQGRVLAIVASLALAATGAVELRELRRISAHDVATIDRAVRAADSLAATPPSVPVVFLRRFEQQPVIQQRPHLASSVALLDFDGNTAALPDFWVFERDMARRVERAYPRYRLAGIDSLSRLPAFIAIARAEDAPVLERLFPGYEITERSTEVYAAVRR